MGYRSDGYGTLTVRNGKEFNKAIEELRKTDISIDSIYPDKNQIDASFQEGKMYTMKEEIKTCLEYFNGEFEIQGDEADDKWKLIFLNGELYNSMADIVYKPMKRAKSIEEPYLEKEEPCHQK